MLYVDVTVIPEQYDEEKEEFIPPKITRIQLEHSLISMAKWESKWCKPFLHSPDKTTEEIMDYVKCMTLTQNVKPEVYDHLSQDNVNQIQEYINAPMTATTFSDTKNGKKNHEIVTSELIYYSMIALQIPFECQKWHLNRLLTLIRVCDIKNNPPKKMSRRETLSRNAALNAARRKQLNTKG